MATNLRLQPAAEAALKAEAERSGQSQQEILREAVNRHLGLSGPAASAGEQSEVIAVGAIRPPRTEYRKVRPTARAARPTLDLLDRDDRL